MLCLGDGTFTCNVKPATIEPHLLIKTHSAEYRKLKQNRDNVNLSHSTLSDDLSYVSGKMCNLLGRRTPVKNERGGLLSGDMAAAAGFQQKNNAKQRDYET